MKEKDKENNEYKEKRKRYRKESKRGRHREERKKRKSKGWDREEREMKSIKSKDQSHVLFKCLNLEGKIPTDHDSPFKQTLNSYMVWKKRISFLNCWATLYNRLFKNHCFQAKITLTSSKKNHFIKHISVFFCKHPNLKTKIHFLFHMLSVLF